MKNLFKLCMLLFLAVAMLPAQEEVTITVTNQNLGLIREKRMVSLEKGKQEIRLEQIPSEIDPTSVLVETPGKKFTVLEQNYEFDLISVDKLLNKSIGYTIRIVHPEQGAMEGKLRAFSGGNIVIMDRDSQLQIIPKNDQQRIHLVDYESTRSNFTSRPTLIWNVESNEKGSHPLHLSYLSGGLDWHADYVGRLNDDETQLSIAAWVTVTNTSGRDYENARLKLMAGDINIIKTRRAAPQVLSMTMQDAGASAFEEKAFFEYHLYALQRTTDVLNNQVKQIQLFPETGSRVQKKYRVESTDAEKVVVMVSMKNSKDNNLGIPLPAGKIRVYKSDEKDLEFIGENQIKHTAKDETLDIELGAAFDIVSERIVTSTDRNQKRSRRQSVEYKLRNHKDTDVAVEVRERISPYYDVELHSSSIPVKEKQASFMSFIVPVKANQESILTLDYTTSW